MKMLLSAFWKILLLTIVYFVVNAIMGILLPLSNDMMTVMTPEDQAAFIPLFLLNIFINMTVMYLALIYLKYQGWKLFLAVWVAFFGLFIVLNYIELYWYNESFPLFTYLDVTKLMIGALVAYGLAALVGTWLVGGFKRDAQKSQTIFETGRYGWRIGLFCVIYPLFYLCCGFIPWSFPEAREFYASWALTMEPIPVLLLFNVFRAALWFLFTLPLLLGAKTRKQAFWLVPLVLVTGTAGACIAPSAFLPGIVRLAHFIELGFSMSIVGLFMVWLFLKEKNGQEV
jgi:hypothetical protein